MAKRVFVKRAQLAGSLTYRSWEKYENGENVTGKVVGFFEDSYKKVGIKMEVIEHGFNDSDEGDALIGKILAINSCGALVKGIEELQAMHEANPQEELFIRVEYTGKTIVQKGTHAGKPCHTAAMDLLGAEGEVQQTMSQDVEDDL